MASSTLRIGGMPAAPCWRAGAAHMHALPNQPPGAICLIASVCNLQVGQQRARRCSNGGRTDQAQGAGGQERRRGRSQQEALHQQGGEPQHGCLRTRRCACRRGCDGSVASCCLQPPSGGKGGVPLGSRGILVSCTNSKEQQAAREAIALFTEVRPGGRAGAAATAAVSFFPCLLVWVLLLVATHTHTHTLMLPITPPIVSRSRTRLWAGSGSSRAPQRRRLPTPTPPTRRPPTLRRRSPARWLS